MAVRGVVWASTQLLKGTGFNYMFQLNVMWFNSLVTSSRFVVSITRAIQLHQVLFTKGVCVCVLMNYLRFMWDLIWSVPSVPCELSSACRRKSWAKPAALVAAAFDVLRIPQPRRLPQRRLCLAGDFTFDKQAYWKNLSLLCMSF